MEYPKFRKGRTQNLSKAKTICLTEELFEFLENKSELHGRSATADWIRDWLEFGMKQETGLSKSEDQRKDLDSLPEVS